MKSFVVIGMGRFGTSLAMTLSELGHEVLAIDENPELIQNIADQVTHAVTGDATEQGVLKSLGVRNFDVAVVAIGGSLEASILTTVLLKEVGVKYVLAKAQSEIHARVLSHVGADRVIQPEWEMGERVANQLSQTNILDYIELSEDYSIAEVSPVPSWIGKSLEEIDVRKKYGINIMAIKNENGVNIAPAADDIICDNDVLIVMGENEDLSPIR